MTCLQSVELEMMLLLRFVAAVAFVVRLVKNLVLFELIEMRMMMKMRMMMMMMRRLTSMMRMLRWPMRRRQRRRRCSARRRRPSSTRRRRSRIDSVATDSARVALPTRAATVCSSRSASRAVCATTNRACSTKTCIEDCSNAREPAQHRCNQLLEGAQQYSI